MVPIFPGISPELAPVLTGIHADPELLTLLRVWPRLPMEVREELLARALTAVTGVVD